MSILDLAYRIMRIGDCGPTEKLFCDETVHECANVEQVIRQTKRTLPAMALDQLPRDGGYHTVTVLVRNEDGEAVYTATLTYTGVVLSR